MEHEPIPLTVVGGYLGSGKTTLLDHLLRHPGGRRIGVIVNDFGSLAIDAGLVADAAGGGLVSLPNGCVCCTVGAGLHDALELLATRDPRPDHVVIEVSGVADPVAAAGWGTVAPFEPAGVVVLADATSVIERARDRYVGGDVVRQLAGADLIVVTKSDACDERRATEVERFTRDASGGAPTIRVVNGRVAAEVVLGVTIGSTAAGDRPAVSAPHDTQYRTWSWTSAEQLDAAALERCLESLPSEVLRAKGRVQLEDGSWVLVQVVGRRVEVTPTAPASTSELIAIAVRDDAHADAHAHATNPFVLHFG